jgi:hypothetical protein
MGLINNYIRRLGKLKDWWFMIDTDTETAVADQSEYYLPRDCDILESVYFVADDTKYLPKEVKTRVDWDCITSSDADASYPSYFYIQNNKINFYPTPSSADYTIYFIYKKKIVDLSNDDYTTGTISLTNGDATVTGSGTTFTSSMVGRYLEYNEEWYKISTFTSTTSLELEYEFEGTTGTGLSYTVGEVSVLPEDYQDLPVYKAASIYYTKKELTARAALFDQIYKEGVEDMLRTVNKKTMDVSLRNKPYTLNQNFNPTVS